jgi:bisphosphoglycerate-dependent phosphoglycerate mutase
MEYLEQPSYHHFQQHHHDPISQGMPRYHNEQQNLRDYAAMAHRQSSAMMGMPHGAKTNETKPRLGKDEVDILEREFKKNPKPSTQTKRQFAEEMRVDLARINVCSQSSPARLITDAFTELVPEPPGEAEARDQARGK